ncbi:hypothetical protein ACFY05_39235 [Microtetraspora fusca]|uniref:Uncharacterized protein n=1 Tax=Microtetraspora fusca TaxID=1997 RepID=A0ABW6VJX1_MICFU
MTTATQACFDVCSPISFAGALFGAFAYGGRVLPGSRVHPRLFTAQAVTA